VSQILGLTLRLSVPVAVGVTWSLGSAYGVFGESIWVTVVSVTPPWREIMVGQAGTAVAMAAYND
jgi:hypothetical protein